MDRSPCIMQAQGDEAFGDSQREPETSWIAQERLKPGLPSNQWISASIILAGVTFLVLAVMSLSPEGRVDAEELYRTGDGPVQALDASLAPHISRTLRAAAAASVVLATGFAARRLLHDESASVLAAGLVILDPGFLIHGRLATPVVFGVACAMVSLALFLSPKRSGHWIAAGLLAFACFLDPRFLLWAAGLGVMGLVRGHIYAAPQHAALAGIQTIAIPGVFAILGIVAGDSLGPTCYVDDRLSALLLLQSVDLGSNLMWHPNPATWFAGLGALIWLGGGALVHVLREFRLQRLPGRLQLRIGGPLKRSQGRALWLVALVLVAPNTALWAPLFGIGLAAAVGELGKDAKRFGWAVAVIVLVIALVFTAQLWSMLVGASPTAPMLPWTTTTACA